ncbi:MAG TPA: hypothetical protein VEG62_09000 [Acidimicrobiales bacterium]|nr:hypothetical protein [Acidimicrobiales bacterium]
MLFGFFIVCAIDLALATVVLLPVGGRLRHASASPSGGCWPFSIGCRFRGTVARACVQGLVRREGVFMRTPKTDGGHRLRAAFLAASPETVLGLTLWGAAGALAAVLKPAAVAGSVAAGAGPTTTTAP